MRRGKWQRLILSELEKRPAFYVREILPSGSRRSDCVALHYAVKLLEQRGEIGVRHFYKSVVTRPGYQFDRIAYDRQLREKQRGENIVEVPSVEHWQYLPDTNGDSDKENIVEVSAVRP